MVTVWITRGPNRPNYPGGVWRFWADDENSEAKAERVPNPGNSTYTPYGETCTFGEAVRRLKVGDPGWKIISEEEAVHILLGGVSE